MNNRHNVLFMGETGVGKSVVVGSFLNEMVDQGHVQSYVMGYSAQTKPANLRDVFESKLEKKRKNLLGPPSGKKMFMFVMTRRFILMKMTIGNLRREEKWTNAILC